MTNAPGGLGRIPVFDERSRAFNINALLDGITAPRSYTWSCGVSLDQGAEGACGGFSAAAELAARPVVVRGVTNQTGFSLYRAAQQIDGWPLPHEGTSVLAVAKTLKARGFIDEYRWAFNFDDLITAIGYKGPVILGVNWYSGFDQPAADGLIRIGGQIRGGHAILANGVSLKAQRVRLHNSWGAGWGSRGDCFIGFDDLRQLLSERGEACVPMMRSQ